MALYSATVFSTQFVTVSQSVELLHIKMLNVVGTVFKGVDVLGFGYV